MVPCSGVDAAALAEPTAALAIAKQEYDSAVADFKSNMDALNRFRSDIRKRIQSERK
jgi:formiminotetrahydrofolate cyclodeaminase